MGSVVFEFPLLAVLSILSQVNPMQPKTPKNQWALGVMGLLMLVVMDYKEKVFALNANIMTLTLTTSWDSNRLQEIFTTLDF